MVRKSCRQCTGRTAKNKRCKRTSACHLGLRTCTQHRRSKRRSRTRSRTREVLGPILRRIEERQSELLELAKQVPFRPEEALREILPLARQLEEKQRDCTNCGTLKDLTDAVRRLEARQEHLQKTCCDRTGVDGVVNVLSPVLTRLEERLDRIEARLKEVPAAVGGHDTDEVSEVSDGHDTDEGSDAGETGPTYAESEASEWGTEDDEADSPADVPRAGSSVGRIPPEVIDTFLRKTGADKLISRTPKPGPLHRAVVEITRRSNSADLIDEPVLRDGLYPSSLPDYFDVSSLAQLATDIGRDAGVPIDRAKYYTFVIADAVARQTAQHMRPTRADRMEVVRSSIRNANTVLSHLYRKRHVQVVILGAAFHYARMAWEAATVPDVFSTDLDLYMSDLVELANEIPDAPWTETSLIYSRAGSSTSFLEEIIAADMTPDTIAPEQLRAVLREPARQTRNTVARDRLRTVLQNPSRPDFNDALMRQRVAAITRQQTNMMDYFDRSNAEAGMAIATMWATGRPSAGLDSLMRSGENFIRFRTELVRRAMEGITSLEGAMDVDPQSWVGMYLNGLKMTLNLHAGRGPLPGGMIHAGVDALLSGVSTAFFQVLFFTMLRPDLYNGAVALLQSPEFYRAVANTAATGAQLFLGM